MKQTWRWFGPEDPISLKEIRQAGAQSIVSALHHIPSGDIWTSVEIKKRKEIIESENFTWEIVESLPVHEAIKTGAPDKEYFIDNYIQSLRNLAKEGIFHVVYNFMALTDWTRTDLNYADLDGAMTIRYDHTDLAIFDLFILKRATADDDYTESIKNKAAKKFAIMSESEIKKLSKVILMGLPGTVEDLSLEEFKEKLEIYKSIGKSGLRENLKYFLERIIPVAETLGITMSIHSDDPPIDILGLPRIVASSDDLKFITNLTFSPSNSLCFCSGTLGAGRHNNVVDILNEFAPRISFAHLRNVKHQEDGSFFESKLLEGSLNMLELAKIITVEQKRRGTNNPIPFRPDHGQGIVNDGDRKTYPGYSLIGRLKSLAELRGIFFALE